MMRLCDDNLIPQYRKLTDVIHREGCPAVSQLALGAYYRETNGRSLQVEPDRMTSDEIRLVIRRFIEAAVRAEKAGFDGVQIHAAHFFFLSRFISPALNHRTDEYGVAAEKRARILLEILEGVRRTGIDEETFLTHYRDGSAEAALEKDLSLTRSLGIRTLPAYLIRYKERSLILKSFRYEDFARAIDDLLGTDRPSI